MYQRFVNWFVYAALFLLPWQTRLIFGGQTIGGEAYEYGVISIYAVEMLVFVAMFLRGRVQAEPIAKHAARILALAVFVMLAVMSFAGASWLSLVTWLHVGAAAALFALMTDKRMPLAPAMLSFALGLVTPALLGVAQFLTGWSPSFSWLGLAGHDAATLGASVVETMDGRWLRAYGSFPHPNMFGGALAVALVMLWMLPRWYKTVAERVALQAAAVPLAVALVFTYSRSAWLGLAAASLVAAFILLWEHRIALRKAAPVLLISLVAIAATLVIFREPLSARFDPGLRLEAQSYSERAAGYVTYLDILSPRLLFGTGLAGYVPALASLQPGFPAYDYQPVHNAFFLAFAELGVLGFVLLAWWVYEIIFTLFRALPRPTAVGAVALGIVLLSVALLDHYLWSQWSGLALTAVVTGISLRLAEK